MLGLRQIGFQCSFTRWCLGFPKLHWRRIETSLSRQVLDGMVGKVNESKENAKIRMELKFYKIFYMQVNKLSVEKGEYL